MVVIVALVIWALHSLEVITIDNSLLPWSSSDTPDAVDPGNLDPIDTSDPDDPHNCGPTQDHTCDRTSEHWPVRVNQVRLYISIPDGSKLMVSNTAGEHPNFTLTSSTGSAVYNMFQYYKFTPLPGSKTLTKACTITETSTCRIELPLDSGDNSFSTTSSGGSVGVSLTWET